jgi:hypothetical protein
MTALGHAAGVLNPVAMVVNTGRSLVALHTAAAAPAEYDAGDAKLGDRLPGGATTDNKSTTCELPSPNASLMEPL